jgi:ribosomal protein L37E
LLPCDNSSSPPIKKLQREYTGNMTETQEMLERQLKVADRCDRCGSQAFVLVKGIAGELMFCGHHYAKNEEALVKYSYEIVDERSHINSHSASSPI